MSIRRFLLWTGGFGVVVGGGLIVALAVWSNNQGVAEADQMIALDAKVQCDQGASLLSIKGLIGDSSLAVGNVDTVLQSTTLLVLVHLAIAYPGNSGNISLTRALPANLARVEFGNTKAVIWQAARSCAASPAATAGSQR